MRFFRPAPDPSAPPAPPSPGPPQEPQEARVAVRIQCYRDRPEILAIDRATCLVDREAGVPADEPLTETSLMAMLGRRGALGFVAVWRRPDEEEVELAPPVVGYAVAEAAGRPNRRVRPSLRLVDLAVCPTCRRRGVAAALLGRLKEQVVTSGMAGLVATVHERNGGVITLLAGAGFVGRLERGCFRSEGGMADGMADGIEFTWTPKGEGT